MWPRLIRCFLAATLLWPLAAFALILEPTSGLRQPVSLSGQVAALCGGNAQDYFIESVAAPERAGEFVAQPFLLLKGYTRDTCWLRFELQRTPDAPSEWLLEVGMPYLDEVTLFVPEAGGGFRSLRMGDRSAYAERPVPHRLFVFPAHLPDAQPATAYLRIRTSSTMLVETLNVWQPNGLLASAQAETALYWLVFGLVALGALSNLVFWIWLREKVYVSYAFYLLALLALNLSNSGYATQWLWPQSPIVADRAIGFMVALIALAGLHFFDEVIGLRENFPRLGRAIPFVMAFYGISMVMAIIGHYAPVAPLLQIVVLTVTLGIMVAGPWLISRGRKDLWLYVIAFSTQLFIAIAALLRNLGVWPLTLPVDHFILWATGIHVVLLNFALAERVRQAQRDKIALETVSSRMEAEENALAQQRDFMAMVAHEFRTPLSIIDTSAQRIAANRSDPDPDKLAERCANIREAVHRLMRLMDEFLTAERTESLIRHFSPEPSRIDALVADALAEFPARRIDIWMRQNLPETLNCDPALVRIALGNLMSNALRYSPPGRPVRFTAEGQPGGGVIFSVANDGPDIPADEQARLFEKYFRGRDKRGKPGTGLGLYLVAQVAAAHGGTAEVFSLPGNETRFTLTIPPAKENRQ